jgi:multiple antibiotic resistance protein
MMIEISNAFLLVFAGLFPVVNPLGSAPIFLSFTSACPPQQRNQLALGVALNSFWLLLGSMLFGSAILEFFGITIPIVRVAGGILVTAMGWKMFDASGGSKQEADRADERPEAVIDSFYPLTLPLTVGPGAISVALTIGSHRPRGEFNSHAMLIMGSALVGLFAITLAIFLSYRFAASLVRSLGPGGVNVLIRLSAFILVCIGMQIAWGGLTDLIREVHRSLALS